MGVRVRRATPQDEKAICQLLDEQNVHHARLLPSFFRLSATQGSCVGNVLENPRAVFLVAEARGKVVGLAELHLTQTKSLPILVQKPYVHIGELIVAEAFKGRGIGRALMDASRDWARKCGAGCLRTSVVPTNEGARRFYAREGFHDIMVSIESSVDERHVQEERKVA